VTEKSRALHFSKQHLTPPDLPEEETSKYIVQESEHLHPEYIKKLIRIRKRCYGQGQNGIVATSHRSATKIGLSVLREGGNAVDAAVAAAWALSICEPGGSGLPFSACMHSCHILIAPRYLIK